MTALITVAILKTVNIQQMEDKILQKFYSYRYETSKKVQKRAIQPLRQRTEENSTDNTWKQSKCLLQIGRLTLVQMGGESSTRLQDDTRIRLVPIDEHYRQYRTVEVYDNMYYQLQVQLSCQGLIGLNSGRNKCANAQDIYAWIDFNDNNYPDPSEIHRLYRAQSKRRSGVNMYDLEVYIPTVDEVKTTSGAHKMTLSIKPSEMYRRTCGIDGYEEIRDYTVIIRSRRLQHHLSQAGR